MPDDRLRLIFTCCHPALAREAQVALTLRLVCGVEHHRHRPGVPGHRVHHGRPGDPGQEEDLGRAHRLPGAAAATSCPTGSTPSSPSSTCCTPPVTPRPSGPELVRADLVARAIDLARMLRAAHAGRAGGPRPARAPAAHRRPPGHPDRRGRPAAAAGRAGPVSRWDRGRHRRGPRRWSWPRCGAAGPAGSPCRPRSPPCTPTAPSYAETDWPQVVDALRRAAAGVALAGRRPQPGRRRRDGRRARRAGLAAARRPGAGRAAAPATATCRRPGPTCCASSAVRRRRWPPTAARGTSPTTTPSAPFSPAASRSSAPEHARAPCYRRARYRSTATERWIPVRRGIVSSAMVVPRCAGGRGHTAPVVGVARARSRALRDK